MQTVHSALQPVIQGPWTDGNLRSYSSEVAALIAEDCNDAVHFFYPEKLRSAAAQFNEGFEGKTVYAVKANPSEAFLLEAWRSGVRAFDVASLREVETLHQLLPEADLFFMHPIKSRQSIRRAFALGVRTFALDSLDELRKIQEETGYDKGLTLAIRIAVKVDGAAYDLDGKFGVSLADAANLVREVSLVANRIGLCFHVGSQCMDAMAFRSAIKQLADITSEAGITPDIIDVGGGFPVAYPGMEVEPLETYFDVIHEAISDYGFSGAELLCEPGRALVAEAGATAARVELRRSNSLYLNDGTYGALFDAGSLAWPFAVRLLRLNEEMVATEYQSFDAYGPTCDSVDHMEGPFQLPVDAREGDWIVFENLGSYGQAMQSRFNGFYSDTCVSILADNLALETFTPSVADMHASNTISAVEFSSEDTAPALDRTRLVSEFSIVAGDKIAVETVINAFNSQFPEELDGVFIRRCGDELKVRVKSIDEQSAISFSKALKALPNIVSVYLELFYR